MSLIWKNACIVRKCSTLLCGLHCDGLVCELLGSKEMTWVFTCGTPNLVESRVIWQGLLSMGDWSGKRLLRGSMTRRLRSLKTLTESRRQITLSVRMMAKENKMLLSTTWWRYRYFVACVILIDRYGVPLLVSLFLCVCFTMDSLRLFFTKMEKEWSYQLGFRFTLTTW